MARITHGDEMHRDAAAGAKPFEEDPGNTGVGGRFQSGFRIVTSFGGDAYLVLDDALAALSSGDETLYLSANQETAGGSDAAKIIMLGGHGLVIPILTADPGGTASENGQVYYNSTSDKFRAYEDGAWTDMIGGSGVSDILDLPTAETDDTLVLAPDGAGGVEFRAETGGAGTTIPNLFVGSLQASIGYGSPSITSALSANRGYFMKFIPSQDVTVDTARWNCTTSNGNLCFAIYDASFNRLATTGSFASPGTGSRSQALGASVDLDAGVVYYLAMSASSTTLRMPALVPVAFVASPWNLVGIKASALPLPDPGTPDNFDGGVVIPIFFFD